MSGYTSKDMRHNCVTGGCLQDKVPNLEWLRGLFPRPTIMPTDVDAMVEIKGNFLFIEHKGLGGELSGGQRTALRNLARIPGITVLVIQDTTVDDRFNVHWWPPDDGDWRLRVVDLADLQDRIRRWALEADTRVLTGSH